MNVLTVENLCKKYPAFALENVSFSVQQGQIMGFIGRNGAGKTTTLKSLLDLVHPDAGSVAFFGKPFAGSEFEAKQNLGFASGGVNYYPKKKLKAITAATRRFYLQWDDAAYRGYLARFSLDENKTPDALSEGMKVKYALALALSHRAKLLILDEPTSGLDPVSREDLLDLFLSLADEGVSILFSTHITSDLEKCADAITYIQKGKILASLPLQEFLAQYKIASFATETLPDALPDAVKAACIGTKRAKNGASALLLSENAAAFEAAGISVTPADLESVMVHLEKED